jgi:transposase-like protein
MIETQADRKEATREVAEKPQRRKFTAEEKLAILRRVDACTKPGELGAVLRAEGLYSSHLMTWRRQREAGELEALTPKKRGRKPAPLDARDKRIAELEKENRRLAARATKAEAIVDLQKKVSEILGITLPDPEGKI